MTQPLPIAPPRIVGRADPLKLPRGLRRDLVALTALCALPAMLLAAILLVGNDVRPLEEGLVRAAHAFEKETCPRPVHTSVVEGSFGDAIGAVLPEIENAFHAILRLSPPEQETLEAVAGGRLPVSQLSSATRQLIDARAGAVAAALAATHTSRVDLPARLRLFATDPPWRFVKAAAQIATVQIWQAIARDDVSTAVAICLDTLALGRDATYGGPIGFATGVLIQERALQACTAALDAATPNEKAFAIAVLENIRRGGSPFGDVVRREDIVIEIVTFTAVASEAALLQLPPAARTLADTEGKQRSPILRFFWRRAWGAARRFMDRQEHDLALPASQRPDPSEWLARTQRVPNALAILVLRDVGRLDLRERAASARLSALQLAAELDLERARTGRWRPGVPVHWLVPASAQPAFVPWAEAFGSFATVHVRLVHPAKTGWEELRLDVHADGVAAAGPPGVIPPSSR
jgi:hypothetical protein